MTWTKIHSSLPSGFSFFEDEKGRIAILDDTAESPEGMAAMGGDGPLWLDVSEMPLTVVAEGGMAGIGADLPFRSRKRNGIAVRIGEDDLTWLCQRVGSRVVLSSNGVVWQNPVPRIIQGSDGILVDLVTKKARKKGWVCPRCGAQLMRIDSDGWATCFNNHQSED